MNQTAPVRELLRRLLPADFGCAVLHVSQAAPPLMPGEEVAVARAIPKRRHEFALGRLALRMALAEAGHDLPPDRPIPSRADRRPDLPDGIRASLSHGGAFCVAVASPVGGPWVGVDIESATRSAPEGLAESIAPYRMTGDAPLLAFCVKEAMFKAQFPLTGRMLDFSDVPAVIRGGRARACLGARLIAARWGAAMDHYLAVSLWRG